MIEVSVAKLRSRLASLLEAVRAGDRVMVRRHGTPVAVLTPPGERDALRAARLGLEGASRLPRRLDTGPVQAVKVRRRLRRAPSDELAEEGD